MRVKLRMESWAGYVTQWERGEMLNPLALKLDIYNLAHHLCKM